MFKNRNITETAEEFFNLSWDDVQTPYDLDFIEEAATRVNCAVFNEEKIAIIVDPDVDGLSSSAILTNYLKRLDPSVNITHIFHEEKKHGLANQNVMKRIRDEIKPDLLIIPDASGSETQYTALTKLNIDIVVLDHHPEMCAAPNDRVIIVNNQQSKKYKNKELSGVGVVWQFLRVLDVRLDHDWADEWLDVVALGLVADVMSNKSRETRFLIQEGLNPENVQNPLMIGYAKANLFQMKTTRYNPTKIGWNLGPILNSVMRIGSMEETEMLFKALLEDGGTVTVPNGKRGSAGEMVPLVTEALRQATNAKSRQTRKQNKLIEMLEEYIAEHELAENQVIIIKIDEFDKEERALSGVVAGRLVSRYQRPVLLAYRNKEDNKRYEGSARAPEEIPCFVGFKTQCNGSELFEYAAGHEAAFGVCFKAEKFDAIVDYFNKRYEGQSTEITYNVDFVFDADDPNLSDTIMALEKYQNWWGKGIEEPLIAVTDSRCTIHDIQLMSSEKNPTLKFNLNDVAAIKFRSSHAEFDSLCKPGGKLLDSNVANNLNFVGKASVNRYKDTITPQLLLEYYEYLGQSYEF